MFCHLHLHTPYSFPDGASDIEVLVREAATVKFVEAFRGYGAGR
jgi:DNA polymerase III alpha subunit